MSQARLRCCTECLPDMLQTPPFWRCRPINKSKPPSFFCRTCSQSCCRRTPCNHCASSRARKCHSHRLPCTGCGSDRARSTTAAAAFLAHAASPLVTTSQRQMPFLAAAVLAEVALPPVLGATTLIGLAAAPPVLAEAHSRPRQRRQHAPNTPKHAK